MNHQENLLRAGCANKSTTTGNFRMVKKQKQDIRKSLPVNTLIQNIHQQHSTFGTIRKDAGHSFPMSLVLLISFLYGGLLF